MQVFHDLNGCPGVFDQVRSFPESFLPDGPSFVAETLPCLVGELAPRGAGIVGHGHIFGAYTPQSLARQEDPDGGVSDGRDVAFVSWAVLLERGAHGPEGVERIVKGVARLGRIAQGGEVSQKGRLVVPVLIVLGSSAGVMDI